jgi:anti-anti-sigma factor
MPANRLKTEIRHQAGVVVVDLCGDVDGASEEALDAAYVEAERQDPAFILLDFEQVPYINSKGIALIVTLLRRAREAGRQLLACGLTEHYREIFEITRLSEYIGICENKDWTRAQFEDQSMTTWTFLSSKQAPARSERKV